LLAPPEGHEWRLRWTSEATGYGGDGRAPVRTHPEWLVRGESAMLLGPRPEVRGKTDEQSE
jgi:maltooligosyltrehalose trehalohydrolase